MRPNAARASAAMRLTFAPSRDVAADQRGLRAQRLAVGGNRFGLVAACVVVDDDPAAETRERARCRGADAGRGAGDEDRLALQILGHFELLLSLE